LQRRTISAEAKLGAIIIAVVAISFVALMVGRYIIMPDEILNMFLTKLLNGPQTWSNDLETVVMNVRLPRIFAALLVGAALSGSGAAYQGLFRNPMVSSDILGVSAGASFGAVLGILLSMDFLYIQLMAFAFGLLAVTITYLTASRWSKNSDALLSLILGGIIVGMVFTSFISLTKYLADPLSKLPAITFWLMGGLSSIRSAEVEGILGPVLLGLLPMFLLRWKFNILTLGDEEARALGVNTARLRKIIIFCATLMTASAVAVAGIIGLVGLIVPHLARFAVGPDYRVLMPASVFMGGGFLLLVDTLSRTILSVEIPLGILTSIIGAPIFMYLLLTSRRTSEC